MKPHKHDGLNLLLYTDMMLKATPHRHCSLNYDITQT